MATFPTPSPIAPFPDALASWITAYPRNVFYGGSDADRALRAKIVLAQCKLFWERDLQPWEKETVHHLLSRSDHGLRYAMHFLSSGAQHLGDFQETAPLREMYRACHLKNYLCSVPIFNDPRISTPLKSAWSVFSSAWRIMSSAYNSDKKTTRLFASAFVVTPIALSVSPLIFSLLSSVSLGAPALLGLSTLSTASTVAAYVFLMHKANDATHFLQRKDSLGLLNKAFMQGLNRRIKKALAKPSLFHTLNSFAIKANEHSYALFSASIQAAISEQQFDHNIKIIDPSDSFFTPHYEAKLAHVEAMELSFALTQMPQALRLSDIPNTPNTPNTPSLSAHQGRKQDSKGGLVKNLSQRMAHMLSFSKLLKRQSLELQDQTYSNACPNEVQKEPHGISSSPKSNKPRL